MFLLKTLTFLTLLYIAFPEGKGLIVLPEVTTAEMPGLHLLE